jgi:VIT1/CCC1 family predicted Fe2+/Mn2+ transporter
MLSIQQKGIFNTGSVMEFKPHNPNNPTSPQASQLGTDTVNTDSIAKDRLESVDTIRQILFGEDRRVLDAKINSLTTAFEQLARTHREDLANLEARLSKSHEEEKNTLTKMLAEAQANQKTALETLASHTAEAAKTSNAAIENKFSILQIGMQTQNETSIARLRELSQTSSGALAQLKQDNKAIHDASVKTIDEKISIVDRRLTATTQNLSNYITPKQFGDALRSLAKEFDGSAAPVAPVAPVAPIASATTNNNNSAFQR